MSSTEPPAPAFRSVELATAADLPEIAETMQAALIVDPFWTGMKGTISLEEEYKFIYDNLVPRIVKGTEYGACEFWKVVDENGKILGWAGFGKPIVLTEEQKKAANSTYIFPPGRNEGLCDLFQNRILPAAAKNGFDPTRDFQRQNTMVRPEYQRQGIGRMLTKKLNEIADAGGAATHVRARPGASALFVQMGYEILERIDFDLGDYGAEGGKTALFVMRRPPGAKEEKGKKLDWS
ncbi:uncharacterized protein LY89DRAFT_779605 [Mollisia scopiformis]|uniref:N-acetyltransferase domain-containing protein n=1 Tax=Mollisia scopiformis TaxID=149040 RepID=A0A194XHJ6_MOLSC|nr:uncharacterized protein LY89DRAFT_779605 [Mollisia scopiformis]KUJ19685.1 hypothetical protein LY89DRAFT_779605 [Mollisia scopiformis]